MLDVHYKAEKIVVANVLFEICRSELLRKGSESARAREERGTVADYMRV